MVYHYHHKFDANIVILHDILFKWKLNLILYENTRVVQR